MRQARTTQGDANRRADQPQGVGTLSWPPAATSTWPLSEFPSGQHVEHHTVTMPAAAIAVVIGGMRLCDGGPGPVTAGTDMPSAACR